jgi:hypothetical protein
LNNAANGDDAGIEITEPETEAAIQANIEITQMGNLLDVHSNVNFDLPTVITVTNVLGQQVVYESTATLLSGKNLITLPADLSGFHIITFRTGNEVVSHKVIL